MVMIILKLIQSAILSTTSNLQVPQTDISSMHISSHILVQISQKAHHLQDTDRIQCNHQASNYIQARPRSAGPILHLSAVHCSTAKIP
ncbi:hypothetical protein ACN38_g1244 [Penicillium nordicum]|uniref:Uncharacterized protein n=1 Tax=Penicillium nordicum TaxID=229535 RepID=A0A0M9WJX8_9EURO|nr:hypothetical protein ACN38_g1244 [Penicillium nordicum]